MNAYHLCEWTVLLCVPRAIKIQANRIQPQWCQRKEKAAFQTASFHWARGRRWKTRDGAEGNVFIYKRRKGPTKWEGKTTQNWTKREKVTHSLPNPNTGVQWLRNISSFI